MAFSFLIKTAPGRIYSFRARIISGGYVTNEQAINIIEDAIEKTVDECIHEWNESRFHLLKKTVFKKQLKEKVKDMILKKYILINGNKKTDNFLDAT